MIIHYPQAQLLPDVIEKRCGRSVDSARFQNGEAYIGYTESVLSCIDYLATVLGI